MNYLKLTTQILPNLKTSSFFLLVMCSGINFSVACGTLTTKTVQQPATEVSAESIKRNQEEQAKRFGLSHSEWQRYETIMKSSLGWEMQKSHPIAVLGRTATTAEERAKYAQLLVKHEYQLAEGLLAFNNARTQAWKQLYPTLPIIKSSTPERVALYASPSCKDCGSVIQKWRSKGSKVDVYFVGNNSDAALREWAMRMGIRKRDVDEKHITLNHDNGSWLTVAQAKQPPVSMAKNKGGVWSFVTP
ncbi:integrating conjugative element protein [Shewanella sairae]|uniref:Integrating conjugative element protein n=1 Tax=Shewanella sairae TaxID=190310 RepID=A0ABQ4P5U7_9GAMM|nr:TIGR03759 family integrating conjugative element protein [Shewanella sairae]MCL1130484.1 TIGR03759 family integrating conjugative element protein [Shewanella sairae]GIU42893.1 integrating conjugative element protein [Shewanella sairae]